MHTTAWAQAGEGPCRTWKIEYTDVAQLRFTQPVNPLGPWFWSTCPEWKFCFITGTYLIT